MRFALRYEYVFEDDVGICDNEDPENTILFDDYFPWCIQDGSCSTFEHCSEKCTDDIDCIAFTVSRIRCILNTKCDSFRRGTGWQFTPYTCKKIGSPPFLGIQGIWYERHFFYKMPRLLVKLTDKNYDIVDTLRNWLRLMKYTNGRVITFFSEFCLRLCPDPLDW